MIGLEEYDYIWVIYNFNYNTNILNDKKKGKMGYTYPGKIKPPLLLGESTGLFSTRS